MHVDDSVEIFRQSSKSFGWKCKLNWKKNRFFEWNSSKSSRTFRMKLWQNWQNFFSELRFFFRSNTKLNETWLKICKKNREDLSTRRMQFGQRCWTFSPEVWTIIDQSPRTSLKPSKKKPFSKCSSEQVNCSFDNMPKRLQRKFKKLRPCSGKDKKFSVKFFLIDMFLLAGGIQFGPPCLDWYNEKTKKSSLDVRKNHKR